MAEYRYTENDEWDIWGSPRQKAIIRQLLKDANQIPNKADASELAKKLGINDPISVTQIDKTKGKLDQTYMTPEFLQQIAGTAPVNSIPADGSVTNMKMVQNAIDAWSLHPFLLSDFNGKKVSIPTAGSFENGAAMLFSYDVSSTDITNLPLFTMLDFYTESDNISQVKIKVIGGTSVNDFSGDVLNSAITPIGKKRVMNLKFNGTFTKRYNFIHVYVWAYAIDINKVTDFYYNNVLTMLNSIVITPTSTRSYPLTSNGVITDVVNLPTQVALEKNVSPKIKDEIATKTTPFKGYDVSAKGNTLNPTKIQMEFVFDTTGLNLTTSDVFTFKADVLSSDPNISKLESQYFINNGSAFGDTSGVAINPSGSVTFVPTKTTYTYSTTMADGGKNYIHCFLNAVLTDGTKVSSLQVNNITFTVKGVTYTYPEAKGIGLYRGNSTDVAPYKVLLDDGIVTYKFLPSYIVINNLVGKKINLLGDSITAGHTLGFSATWGYAIGQRNKMTARNYGINGTCLGGASNAFGASMATRYVDMDNDSDYIIVMGGTNDQGSGNIPMGTDSDYTVDTFKGALNVLCRGLIEKFPKAKIGFMTPYHNHDNVNATTGLKIIDYVDAIIKICGNYGIPVLDNYRMGGVLPLNMVQRNALMLSDGIHFTAEGHQFISKRIEGFINSL